MVLVKCPLADSREKSLPNTRLPLGSETVAAVIPAVEIAHDRNLLGIGRPDGKMSAAGPLMVDPMSAEFAGESKMAALVKKIKIVVGQETCSLMVSHRF